jgi:hypothetical protein
MKRALLIVVAILVCCPMGSLGQGIPSTPITLTEKITSLGGVWIYDPSKGVDGSCDLEWPDGSLSSTGCSYRRVIVYQRQEQP